jgi:hypothetical protein
MFTMIIFDTENIVHVMAYCSIAFVQSIPHIDSSFFLLSVTH